ncbi:hypothetical protein FQZ97_961860 [compost metagenome]
MQLKNDRQRNGSINRTQDVVVQLRSFELDVENLNLRHLRPRRQVKGLRRQLVGPGYLFDLSDKLVTQRAADLAVLIDLGFRHRTANSGLTGKRE